MERRAYLAMIGSAGIAATAGCSAFGGSETLSEPTVREESAGRRSLGFTAGGEEIGSFGADGELSDGVIDLTTEFWHREGTKIRSIRLAVWMPTSGEGAGREDVAVVSPVQGDSSPPPSITLSTAGGPPRSVIEITDLDDLADETISTLDLVVRPRGNPSTTVAIDATIELASGGIAGTDYTLDGQLELTMPSQ